MKTGKQTAEVNIRWMIDRDIPEVLEIESHAPDFQWTEEVFRYHMRQRGVVCLVAEFGEKVVGFMVYALGSTTFGLFNIAVDPYWRRLKVGQQMIARLAGKLSKHRRTRIVMHAHEGNLDLHLFLRAMGFWCEGVEGEFYTMVRRIADGSERPNRIAKYFEARDADR